LAQVEKPPQKMHVGKIVEVAKDYTQFTLQMGEAEQSHKVVLKVTAETKFELDGKASTAEAALVVGRHVRANYMGDRATEVMVTTETPAGGNHERGDKTKDKD
jgi:hypothetical protein